jgi:Fe2+ transport system protein FeoA
VNITQLANGTSARVIKISARGQLGARLAAMGITPETVITKKGASFLRGPVVIQKGQVQIAIGYSMAQKIIVEQVE